MTNCINMCGPLTFSPYDSFFCNTALLGMSEGILRQKKNKIESNIIVELKPHPRKMSK